MSIKRIKGFIKLLKYYPFLINLVILIAAILRLSHIELYVLRMVFSTSIISCVLLLLGNKIFNFCKWHRVMIYNILTYDIYRAIDFFSEPFGEITWMFDWLVIAQIAITYILFLIFVKRDKKITNYDVDFKKAI